MPFSPFRIARELSEDGPFTREQAERLAFLKYWIDVIKDEPINTLKVAKFLSENGTFGQRQAEGIAKFVYDLQLGRYDL
jgi:hypothetical protein